MCQENIKRHSFPLKLLQMNKHDFTNQAITKKSHIERTLWWINNWAQILLCLDF